MFKLTLALVAVSALAASPVITLDLAAVTKAPLLSSTGPLRRTATAGYADTHDHEAVCSVAANDGLTSVDGTAYKECVLPTPHAYDHHDGILAVTTTFKTMIQNLGGNADLLECQEAGVTCAGDGATPDFATRAMYVLNYAAVDASGNHALGGKDVTAAGGVTQYEAENVRGAAAGVDFALVVQDTVCPTLGDCTGATTSCSLGSTDCTFAAFTTVTGNDAVDGTITPTSTGDHYVNTCEAAGSKSATLTYCDFAGIFGTNHQNNCCGCDMSTTITDAEAVTLTITDADKLVSPNAVSNVVECTSDGVYVATTDQSATEASATPCNCEAPLGDSKFYNYGDSRTNCKIGYTRSAISTLAGSTSSHSATFSVAVAAQAYSQAASATEDFSITDTTNPVLTLLGNGASKQGAAGTHSNVAVAHDFDADNQHDGDWGDAAVVTNVFEGNSIDGATHANHIIQHSAGYAEDTAQIKNLFVAASSFSCADDCDSSPTSTAMWAQVSTTTSCDSFSPTGTGDSFTVEAEGTYMIKYTCTDEATNTVTDCRTIINMDHTRPIINVINAEVQHAGCGVAGAYCVAAHSTNTYTDEGATCSDQVDGLMSEKVEVSGDIVDLKQIGTYVIAYDATDSASNDALQATRTVVVFDTICPTCGVAVDGVNEFTIEASFPLGDALLAAVTCTDDTGLASNVADRSGDDAVDVELTGTYKITYTATDANGNTNFEDLNGMACTLCDTAGDANHNAGVELCDTSSQIRTVHVEDTLIPVITITPTLMQEDNKVNIYMIGAIASAISGLALVGFAARKSTVATSVPV
jgi:hypothetical protein